MAGWFEVWKLHGTALLAGCVLDWILGDPYHFPHPVRLMGRMISWLEGRLRKRLEARELAAGFFLTAVMSGDVEGGQEPGVHDCGKGYGGA